MLHSHSISLGRLGAGGVFCLLVVCVSLAQAADDIAESAKQPTHKLSEVLTLEEGGKQIIINTFCVDARGRLLAACGGNTKHYVKKGDSYESIQMSGPNELRVLDATGKTLKVVPLPIQASAMNIAPDGSIYMGSGSQLIKLDKDYRIVATADSPSQSKPSPEQEARKQQMREELQRSRKTLQNQIDHLNQKLSNPKTSDSVKQRMTKRIEQYEQSLQDTDQSLNNFDAYFASLNRSRSRITGIATTAQDVFICCNMTRGYGYAIHRMDTNLANPTQITEKLSGCCGQLDIQTHDGKVYAAENSRMRVICYDRDGKRLGMWGQNARKSKSLAGFGACCNPMNIRFGSDGFCYTSEASVGAIKRFSPDGEFQQLICQAENIPSCKHTPIGLSPTDGRIYMLNAPQSQIFVFKPAEQAAQVNTGETTDG